MRLHEHHRAAITAGISREVLTHGGGAVVAALVFWPYADVSTLWLAIWLSLFGAGGAIGWFVLTRPAATFSRLVYWRAALALLWILPAGLIDPAWPPAIVAFADSLVLLLAVHMLVGPMSFSLPFAVFCVPVCAVYALRLVWMQGDLELALAVIDLAVAAGLVMLARRLEIHFNNNSVLQNAAQDLEQRLQWTNRAYREQQMRVQREEALAKQVFERLILNHGGDTPEITRWFQPTGSFSGDLLLHTYSPSGSLNILFCDFTGHGLPAALGAIPVSGVFYTMARKEFSPSAITDELNKRLCELLPVDYFCCALMLRFTPDRRHVEVCNSGLPPVLVLDARGCVKARHASELLPLGIARSSAGASQQQIELEDGDAVYLFSDGLIESESPRGEMFGLPRLEDKLGYPSLSEPRIDVVRKAVLDFMGAREPDDDISLVELRPDYDRTRSGSLARAS